MKKIIAIAAICAATVCAFADGTAFGRGTIAAGNETGVFAFSAFDFGPNSGGSVGFAAGDLANRSLSVAMAARAGSAEVGPGQAMFAGMGMYYSSATGRIQVMVEVVVTDGGMSGPDTFAIRAIDAANVVLFEASGDLLSGNIVVNGS